MLKTIAEFDDYVLEELLEDVNPRDRVPVFWPCRYTRPR
jgi:hypothetical protein